MCKIVSGAWCYGFTPEYWVSLLQHHVHPKLDRPAVPTWVTVATFDWTVGSQKLLKQYRNWHCALLERCAIWLISHLNLKRQFDTKRAVGSLIPEHLFTLRGSWIRKMTQPHKSILPGFKLCALRPTTGLGTNQCLVNYWKLQAWFMCTNQWVKGQFIWKTTTETPQKPNPIICTKTVECLLYI